MSGDHVPFPASPPVERDDLPAAGIGAPGSWGMRAIARLTDYLLLNLLAAIALTMIIGRPGPGEQLTVPTWLALVLTAAQFLYEVVLVVWRGRTVGKYLGGLVVVRWQDGRRPTITQAVARATVPFVALVGGGVLGGFLGFSPFGILLMLAVYLSSLTHPVFRGIHDRAGGTIVLTTSKPRLGGRPRRDERTDDGV